MKTIKIILLILFIWSLPTFMNKIYGTSIGSFFSYFSFILIIFYFFLIKKGPVAIALLILGSAYFIISGLVNVMDPKSFIFDFIKYILIIICGIELVRKTTNKELFYILMLGSLTIFMEAVFFQQGSGGRYGGLFLNPNGAGFICIVGYCLGYGIHNKYLRISGQFIFIFAGILTFSRTFILLLVIVSIVAIFKNRKHLLTVGIGTLSLVLLFSISSLLKLDTNRFNALEGLFENKIDNDAITEDSRTATWSLYTNSIVNNIFFGNGYKSMQGWESDTVGVKVGVHNTYLMVLGESGIIPFFIMFFIFVDLFMKSIIKHFKENPEYFFLTFVLLMFILTSHNFFDNYAILIITLWIYTRVYDIKYLNNEISPEIVLNTT